MTCWRCGRDIPLLSGEKITNRDACPGCDADLHVCRNCRHFDPTVHNQCQETQAEKVEYKDRNNHCDYFSPVTVVGRAAPQGAGASSDAKKKFDDLFKL
ncbi:MAG: hypothetical protein ACRD2E_02140 [Terriglobales bacterium]